MRMARGLDHIVHAVRDLDACAALYERLGFMVGARNRHDWGTHNRVVQLPGFFIELLTVAEPDKLGSDGLSQLFGAHNRDFLARHEGLSGLLLESRDAAAYATLFRNAGIAASEVLRFGREGRRPDGTPIRLAFSLAFARDPAGAEAAFAACQHHFPENFWNPAFQQHRNGTTGVAGVVMVAENPSDHHIFLRRRRELFFQAASRCGTFAAHPGDGRPPTSATSAWRRPILRAAPGSPH
jgi:catechol 2,3-dioxygenase-like lactoylglutathione lyase family enzyme